MPVINNTVVQAYADALSRAKEGTAGAAADGEAAKSGGGFADMLGGVLDNAAQATGQAEQVSMAAIAQKAELVDVVTAISNAEMTLQTVVTIRDKVIQAYNDIIKMPI